MAELEKLKIAAENEKIREQFRGDLAKQNILIRYTGKNTPFGIPGNGQYSVDNLEHQLAVIKVGTKTETPMQKMLKQQIASQSTQYTLKEPRKEGDTEEVGVARLGIKSVSKIILDYKGEFYPIYLYEDEKQWQPWKERSDVRINEHDKIQVAHQPSTAEIIIKSNDERDLWSKLTALKLTPLDTNEIYAKFRNKIYDHEFNPAASYVPHREVDL